MKFIKLVMGLTLFILTIGAGPINSALTPLAAPAIYAQAATQGDEQIETAGQRKFKLPSLKELFGFNNPKPENLRQATGRKIFITGLVVAMILHQVLPFLFFAIGGTRLLGARLSIVSSLVFLLLMTLWAIGVMMSTGQVLAWGLILLLIFIIWAAVSKR